MCLSYDETNNLMTKNCMDLLISKEAYLWVLYDDNTIRPFGNQSFCIQNDILTENNELILGKCIINHDNKLDNQIDLEKIEKKIYKDEFGIRNSLLKSLKNEEILSLKQRGQYYVIDNFRIKLKNYDEMCMATHPDSSQIISNLKYINSTSNRLNYEIDNILNLDDEKYWASQPFSELPVIIELAFKKPQIIKGISISFVFPAKKYKVFGFYEDFPTLSSKNKNNNNSILLISTENSDLFEILHEIPETKVSSIRIVLEAYHETKSFYHGQFIFAVRSLKFLFPFSKILLNECLKKSDSSIKSQEYNKQSFFFVPHNEKNQNYSMKKIDYSILQETSAKYQKFINHSANPVFSKEFINSLKNKMARMVFKNKKFYHF